MDGVPYSGQLWVAIFGIGIGLALLYAVKVAATRLLIAVDALARIAGDAVGVALAWPVEMGVDLLDRWVARGVDWRERRHIWRTEFKDRLSWDEFQKQLNGNTPVRDELAEAMGLLALKEPFTRADLDGRFKRTMAVVHPDKGGSEYLARLTNEARALILKTKGWRR